jgi:hypothetical protein
MLLALRASYKCHWQIDSKILNICKVNVRKVLLESLMLRLCYYRVMRKQHVKVSYSVHTNRYQKFLMQYDTKAKLKYFIQFIVKYKMRNSYLKDRGLKVSSIFL